jgi:hypothetical protein
LKSLSIKYFVSITVQGRPSMLIGHDVDTGGTDS